MKYVLSAFADYHIYQRNPQLGHVAHRSRAAVKSVATVRIVQLRCRLSGKSVKDQQLIPPPELFPKVVASLEPNELFRNTSHLDAEYNAMLNFTTHQTNALFDEDFNNTAPGPRGGSLISFAIAQPFLWFLMFFSNLGVLIVYRRYLGFKTLTNYFVYNIAVADLCMSFNMLVQMFFFIWPQLSTSEHLCLFRMELMTFFTTVSMMSGVFATVDRFMIIVVNRHYHTVMSVRNVKLMIAVAWVYSFFFAAVPFFCNNWDIVRRCEFVTVVPAWYIVFASSQTILSTIIEIAFYTAIFHVAGRRSRRPMKQDLNQREVAGNGAVTTGMDNGSVRGPKDQLSLRGAKFMGVVLVTYSLCWTPFAVLGYVQIYMYHPSLTLVRMIMVYVGISNSLLNPLVYAWQKKDFRDGLKRLLALRHRHASRVQPEGSKRRSSLMMERQ